MRHNQDGYDDGSTLCQMYVIDPPNQVMWSKKGGWGLMGVYKSFEAILAQEFVNEEIAPNRKMSYRVHSLTL